MIKALRIVLFRITQTDAFNFINTSHISNTFSPNLILCLAFAILHIFVHAVILLIQNFHSLLTSQTKQFNRFTLQFNYISLKYLCSDTANVISRILTRWLIKCFDNLCIWLYISKRQHNIHVP